MNKALSMIGLSYKAGLLKSGEASVENAIKSNEACLVIVAEDASDNTRKKFTDMCKFRNVPIVFFSTKEELGHAIGKEERASLAVLDDNFAIGIRDKMSLSE